MIWTQLYFIWIGYPGIGGSTITYTSGDFSGFGGSSDGTQNYIKTTAPLEHGNSGGAAYDNMKQFVGIPTMVVAGSLNSISYILSVNSIKNWLSGILGNQYENRIIEQQPSAIIPSVNIQNDTTPPLINNAPSDLFWYNAFDDNGNKVTWNYGVGYDKFKDMYVVDGYRKIQLIITSVGHQLESMDKGSGVYSVYYSYSSNLSELKNTFGTEYIITNDNPNQTGSDYYAYRHYLTPLITLPDKEDTYYIGLKFKDKAGNISNQYILTYVYEKNNFLNLKNLKFYSDPNYLHMIGNYDFKMESKGWVYPQYHQYCATKYKDVYVKWQYENNYERYVVRHYGYGIGEMSVAESLAIGGIEAISMNKYKVDNLNMDLTKEKADPYRNNLYENPICYNDDCTIGGVTTSFLLKPQIANGTPTLEGTNRTVIFKYNPGLPFDFMCGVESRNKVGDVYYSLTQTKPLIEDSVAFDNAQIVIANAFTGQQESNSSQSNDEINNNANIDYTFANKLKGYILLQVESVGEAWYVNPADGKRYYMKDGVAAYQMMRQFGLGITNANLSKLPQEGEVKAFPTALNHVKGKILLQVESHGEAWYVNPKTGLRYYMKDGEAAYNLMRYYSLGITNSDLEKITEGGL